MKMRQEICEKCKHCLSCMCGDEFEDCYIKNPNIKRTIMTKEEKQLLLKDLCGRLPYKYFPDEFSSYEDYIKYLKEKGLAIEVTENNNPYEKEQKEK